MDNPIENKIKEDENITNKKEKENEKKKDDEDLEESLSSLNSDDNDEAQEKYSDFLIAQYEKVHRVKSKWRINLKDVILHCDGKEMVFERVSGELTRDW